MLNNYQGISEIGQAHLYFLLGKALRAQEEFQKAGEP